MEANEKHVELRHIDEGTAFRLGFYYHLILGAITLCWVFIKEGTSDLEGILTLTFFWPLLAMLGGLVVAIMALLYNTASKNGKGLRIVVVETKNQKQSFRARVNTSKEKIKCPSCNRETFKDSRICIACDFDFEAQPES